MTPDDFTYLDLEAGYGTVTSRLHLGTPPFSCVVTSDVELATKLLRGTEVENVAVPGSVEARAVLKNLGVSDSDIDMKLRIARYGAYEILRP